MILSACGRGASAASLTHRANSRREPEVFRGLGQVLREVCGHLFRVNNSSGPSGVAVGGVDDRPSVDLPPPAKPVQQTRLVAERRRPERLRAAVLIASSMSAVSRCRARVEGRLVRRGRRAGSGRARGWQPRAWNSTTLEYEIRHRLRNASDLQPDLLGQLPLQRDGEPAPQLGRVPLPEHLAGVVVALPAQRLTRPASRLLVCRLPHHSGRPCAQSGLSRRVRHGPLARIPCTGPKDGAVSVAKVHGWSATVGRNRPCRRPVRTSAGARRRPCIRALQVRADRGSAVAAAARRCVPSQLVGRVVDRGDLAGSGVDERLWTRGAGPGATAASAHASPHHQRPPRPTCRQSSPSRFSAVVHDVLGPRRSVHPVLDVAGA